MAAIILALSAGCTGNEGKKSTVEPVKYDEITFSGELKYRLQQNLVRLKSDKYLPDNVFLTEEESGGWPGDTEGRTILGLVCDSRATRQAAPSLMEIINRVPRHLNSLGYMGPEYDDVLNEQQLSGNGWMLRGLCAYYDVSSDARVLDWIRSIAENLFVKGKGMYKSYPSGQWMLSSDTGCLFIGMDGLIDAYRLVGTPEMKEVIDEMIARFLEIDLVAIQAQTHASLTACRGLVRYAELTGEAKLIQEAEKRWKIYKQYGMTENYENYNWFGRYDTWTEPCAIVDSYILAYKLWQHTGNNDYLNDAQLIYYNAICHTQRSNGGFGCDTCPGEASGPDLAVSIDEAHWCCTMRGAEGLATAASHTFMRDGNTLYLTNFRPCTLSISGLELEVMTDYPGEGSVTVAVVNKTLKDKVKLKVYIPYWVIPGTIGIGEKRFQAQVGKDGFITLDKLETGKVYSIDYSFALRQEETLNKENTKPGQVRYFYGPCILNEEGNPICHLMDPGVTKESGYHHQIVFNQ